MCILGVHRTSHNFSINFSKLFSTVTERHDLSRAHKCTGKENIEMAIKSNTLYLLYCILLFVRDKKVLWLDVFAFIL